MERSLHCTFNELQRRSGERHENLPADDADRYPFDSRSLHLGSGTAVENAASVIAVVVFSPAWRRSKRGQRQCSSSGQNVLCSRIWHSWRIIEQQSRVERGRRPPAFNGTNQYPDRGRGGVAM